MGSRHEGTMANSLRLAGIPVGIKWTQGSKWGTRSAWLAALAQLPWRLGWSLWRRGSRGWERDLVANHSLIGWRVDWLRNNYFVASLRIYSLYMCVYIYIIICKYIYITVDMSTFLARFSSIVHEHCLIKCPRFTIKGLFHGEFVF